MKVTFIEVAGTRIRMVEEGAGTPVLFLHGNLGSARWFERVMSLPGCRTIALDMPNFGASGALGGELSIDGYADAVADFVVAAGLGRPILVGHSLGGAVAISLAARMPESWRGLVLVDSAAPSGLVTPESRHPAIEAMRASRATLAAALGVAVPALGEDAEDRLFLSLLVDDAERMAPAAWIGNAVALGKMDHSGLCLAFRAPVLVLWGALDVIVTEAMARETASAFPGSRFIALEGVGHSVIVEDPGRFRKIIGDFIAAVPGA